MAELSEQDWASGASNVRVALEALGVEVPECLPGEAQACGGSAALHYATYMGLLAAQVAAFWAVMDPDQQEFARHRHDAALAEWAAADAQEPGGAG